MLATAGGVPDGSGWAFEWKFDGFRAVVSVEAGEVAVFSRSLRSITGSVPELSVLAGLLDRPVLLDGELVVLDARGRPEFGRLQWRMVDQPTERLLRAYPVSFYVFDVLHDGDESLLSWPYERRRARLAALGLEQPPVVRCPENYTDVDGLQLLAIAREHGLEGIVAKRLDSAYHPGRRSPDWIKTAIRRTQEVVVGGWTPGSGHRADTFGAIILGIHDTGERLVYAGHVGTGFTNRTLTTMRRLLDSLARASSPFDVAVPREYARKAFWVEPVLVGEVEYREWTSDGHLRQPSWKGLRPDRLPAEIHLADADNH